MSSESVWRDEMQIISPGIKEGFLYQRSTVRIPSHTLSIRKECYHLLKDIERCPIDEWIKSHDWGWVTSPEQKAIAIQSEINWREGMPEYFEMHRCYYNWIIAYKNPDEDDGYRIDKVYPYIVVDDLELAIGKAATVFTKNAKIKTLQVSKFSRDGHGRHREYPVPEGVLQYFRKEFPKRRQKLIEEID